MENILGQEALAGQRQVTFAARALGSDTFYAIEPRLVSDLLTTKRRRAIARLRGLFGASMRLGQPARVLREMRSIHLPYIALGLSFTEGLWEGYCGGRWRMTGPALEKLEADARYDTLVGLGDFWCHRDHVEALIALKRRSRARVVHLVHDLVAVVNPQWTHPHYGGQFVEQLARLAPHVDHWLATSRYVASQLTDYLRESGLPPRPIETIPMGWPQVVGGLTALTADLAILHRHGLRRDGYLLHVGTVEPRKNLGALFDALGQIGRADGRDCLPCVLVGRDGWRSETVRQRLKEDAWLAARVKWIQDASDSELGALYRSARFTVVPSLDEGWGLAVQESLAYGTPCIAAQVGGIPESGLGLATPVTNDAQALAEAIERYSTDEAAITLARAAIATRLGARESLPSWAHSADVVLRTTVRQGVACRDGEAV
jgi:glycosyltransferase involved in cell wall biosynthesis